jgi:hypothetical protein
VYFLKEKESRRKFMLFIIVDNELHINVDTSNRRKKRKKRETEKKENH